MKYKIPGMCPYCDAELACGGNWGMSPEGYRQMKEKHDAGHPENKKHKSTTSPITNLENQLNNMKIKIINTNSYGTVIIREIEYNGDSDEVLINIGHNEARSSIVGREVKKALDSCNDCWINAIDKLPKKLREQFEKRVDIDYLRLGKHLRKIKEEIQNRQITNLKEK